MTISLKTLIFAPTVSLLGKRANRSLPLLGDRECLMELGKYIGSYKSEAIPFWASIAIRIGWLRHRYARHNVSELQVFEDGIVLKARRGNSDLQLRLKEIRRIWFETFHSGSDHKGNESFRIDLIAQNLDVIFSLKRMDCAPDDPIFLLMKGLYDRWHLANWHHYHVVAAIISDELFSPHKEDGKVSYLCMQKPDTRYSYTSRHWEFPGGKVEEGETEPEALQRELHEEMDYDVTVKSHLITVEHNYTDFGITLSCWLCTAKTDQFNRKEHIDHRWLTIDKMRDLDWCAADAPVLDALEKIAKNER